MGKFINVVLRPTPEMNQIIVQVVNHVTPNPSTKQASYRQEDRTAANEGFAVFFDVRWHMLENLSYGA